MEELKHHLSLRHRYRAYLKLIAKVTELTEKYNADQSTQFDPTVLADLHKQLRHKSDILQEADEKISMLIEN